LSTSWVLLHPQSLKILEFPNILQSLKALELHNILPSLKVLELHNILQFLTILQESGNGREIRASLA